MYEKILFVSEDCLPDIRVEKMMNTLSKITEEIHFIGCFKGFTGLKLDKKPIIHSVEWGRRENLLIPPYYQFLARKVDKIIRRIKPDVIIAVNLVAASILDKYGYDFILDYHEAWTLLLEYINPPTIPRRITYMIRKRKYPKLEEKILTRHVFITFSMRAKKYFYEKYGVTSSYVVKNYPSRRETEYFDYQPLECSTKKLVYIGKDLVFFDGQTYRDLRDTVKVLEELWSSRRDFEVILIGYRGEPRSFIKGIGRVQHIQMYKYLSQTHYGILTYKPVRKVQRIVNPNKPYQYGLAGSIPIITSSLEEIIEDLGQYSIIVDADNYLDSMKKTYREILDLECEELDRRRRDLVKHVSENLVWENQESVIYEVVKKY